MRTGLKTYWHLALLSSFVFLNNNEACAQVAGRALSVKYIKEQPKIDGVLDEPIWTQAGKADDFWQYFPTDSLKSTNATTVSMLYNDNTLFIGVKASSKSGKFVVNSLRRDFGEATNDNVTFVFDTFNDGMNAFMFSCNPYGVQKEALISDGGSLLTGLNTTWDIKWQSASKMHEDYYVLEIAIPFSSLKFLEGGQKWRFQIYRRDFQTNEQSSWARVPQNQLLSNIAFANDLIFEKPLGRSRVPLYIVPYVNGLASKAESSEKADARLTFGGDAKIAIGSGLNLDLTVNPDFSNVEVDNIVTNLTRFEVSLPEKRQFFIDNNDLFGSYGNYFNEARPFFSRRIGIVTDSLGNTFENKIIGGARLSGKLDNNWRLGFFDIQTASDIGKNVASNNNAMFTMQRKVFNRSSIGAFIVNRQTTGSYDFQPASERYNRVIGVDYNLGSKVNTWSGKFYVHKSLQPEDNKGNISSQATLSHNNRYWNITTDWVYIDKDFKADIGFVPRKDIFKSGNAIGRTFYHKKGIINKQNLGLVNVMIFKPDREFKKLDHFVWLADNIEFKNQAVLRVQLMWNYTYLTSDFDPTRTSAGQPLPANTAYSYLQAGATFASNNANAVSYILTATFGQFFNGKIYSFSGIGNLRIMPKALVGLVANYDRIILPQPHPSADIILLSPKVDITFNKSLFWSTLIQFSNQRKNLGIQSRLQWRFAPLSDLFLVYNDNYNTGDFTATYRSINLKFTYWLSL